MDAPGQHLHMVRDDISHQQAETFVAADHLRRDGLVALANGRIVGHLVLEPVAEAMEELALAVDDGVQRHGVGILLLAGAVASARLRGIQRLVAWVRADNCAMRRLLIGSRYVLRVGWEDSIARYELEVPARLPRRVAA
jgi:GNAT superfamily N-acetyltransferase